MAWSEKLDALLEKERMLAEQMADPPSDRRLYSELSREYSRVSRICVKVHEFNQVEQEYKDLILLSKDNDHELREIALNELDALQAKLKDLDYQLRLSMLPSDSDDERDALIEIRAGTGGDEAALFANNLLEMYLRYATLQNWKSQILTISETPIGGISQAAIELNGNNVYARMKFESGVHRVQRVPVTESSGRIHTSAATVAVLPEVSEVDIQLDEKDLRIDTFRSQGAGGQHVNTTDSAVRITHLPSGVVAQCQDEKSQHKNKARAMKMLMARLYDDAKQKADAERANQRRTQIGTGDRSERIRTYNFPQGRVSDHRINLTLYKLPQILAGESLDEMIDALVIEDQATKLASQNE